MNCSYTIEVVDCNIIIRNKGVFYKALQACGTSIGFDCGKVTLKNVSNTFSAQLNCIEGYDTIDSFVADLLPKINACCNSTDVNIEGGVQVRKFSGVNKTFITTDEDGDEIECQITECLQEQEDGSIRLTYLLNGVSLTLSEMNAAGYELAKYSVTTEDTVDSYHTDDIKQTEKVLIDIVDDKKTGEEIWYLHSDTERLNPLNKNDYNIMSNVSGLPFAVDLSSKSNAIPFVFCPTGGLVGTFQSLLDYAVTSEGALVNGATPTGITGWDIKAVFPSTQIGDKKTTASGVNIGGNDNWYNNGGGQCQVEKPTDQDCDGFIGGCYDLTTPLEILPGAAIQVVLNVTDVCDADDSDATVTA